MDGPSPDTTAESQRRLSEQRGAIRVLASSPLPPAGARPVSSFDFPPLLNEVQLEAVRRDCGLTPRETEALRAMTQGLPDAAIAHLLQVSLETARKHRQAVLRKCACANRLQLVLWLVHRYVLDKAGASRQRDGEANP